MSSVFSVENTPERATEFFGAFYDHEVEERGSDEEARKELAERYGVSSKTIKRCDDLRMEGKNISGNVLLLTHCLVEKGAWFDLKPTDERIWWCTERLKREAKGEWEANLDGQLQDRKLKLDQHENELRDLEEAVTKGRTAFRNEKRQTQETLEERLRDIDEQERQLNKRTRAFAEREAEVEADKDRVRERERQTSELEILRKAFNKGGPLALQPGKSVALVRWELEEKYQDKFGTLIDRRIARNRRIEIEQEERTFNIMSAPLRWFLLQALKEETLSRR